MSEKVTEWLFGMPLDDMSKEQLIAILKMREEQHESECESLRQSRDMWMNETFKVSRTLSGN